jgi:6-oxo-cyclohex-1-ene-carbonyl-CoA hydrolase
MSMDWLPRDNKLKDHQLVGDEFFGTEPPCTMYERKPLINPQTGGMVDGLPSIIQPSIIPIPPRWSRVS